MSELMTKDLIERNMKFALRDRRALKREIITKRKIYTGGAGDTSTKEGA